MPEHDKRRSHIQERDAADQELAAEAERQRERIHRGLDGAHKPDEKFPIEEAEEAGEPAHKTPHKRHYRTVLRTASRTVSKVPLILLLLGVTLLQAGLLAGCFPRPH